MKLDYSDVLGTPFVIGGESREGLDCYHLCRVLGKRIDKEFPPFFSLTDEANIVNSIVNEGRNLFIRLDKPEPFCLVTFMIKPPLVSHIGMVLEDCISFIHILNNKRGVSVERLDDLKWKRRIEGFYDIR